MLIFHSKHAISLLILFNYIVSENRLMTYMHKGLPNIRVTNTFWGTGHSPLNIPTRDLSI